MALVLQSEPARFRLSDTPAFFKVHTDMYDSTAVRVEASVMYVSWDGDENVVGTDVQVPDSHGVCVFQLEEYFSVVLQPAFTFPDSLQPFTVHEKASGRFMISFREYYGDPVVLGDALLLQDYFYVVCGFVPVWSQRGFRIAYGSYHNKLQAGDSYLNLAHIGTDANIAGYRRSIKKQDTQKLFVHIYGQAVQAAFLRLELFFSDGTSVSYDYYPPPVQVTAEKGQVIEFHTGYESLGLDSFVHANYPGKRLIGYSAWPYTDPGIPLAGFPVHYVMDERMYRHRRQFLFRTSFGGYDTLCFAGQGTVEQEIRHEVADTSLWPGHVNEKKKSLRSDGNCLATCNTGFLERNAMRYLTELLISVEAYELIEGRLFPVLFGEQKVVTYQDKDGLLSAEFEYSYVDQYLVE